MTKIYLMNYASICCHGLFFYIEEMAQWLEDNSDFEVYTLVSDESQKHLCELILNDRYKKHSNIVTYTEFMENKEYFYVISNNYSHETLYKKTKNNEIKFKIASKQCKGFYIAYSANTHKYITNNMNLFKTIIPMYIKTKVLYNTGFSYAKTEIQGINITRGLYFNNYKDDNSKRISAYFTYRGYNDNKNIRKKIKKKHYIEHDIYTEKYVKTIHDIDKDWSNDYIEAIITKRSNNPGATFDGLIYTRYKDYMPRQPFEFWHYDKPVILNDISDGLMNILGKDLKTDIPIVDKRYLKMDLANLIEVMDRR